MKNILQNSAILVGNGINLYSNISVNWQNALEGLYKEIKGDKKLKDTLFHRAVIKGESVSAPDLFDILLHIKFQNSNTTEKTSLKTDFVKLIEGYDEETKTGKKTINSQAHEDLVTFAVDNSIPILTTNYDCNFIKASDYLREKLRTKYLSEKGYRPITTGEEIKNFYRYPYKSYFSDHEIKNNLQEFGIWHMHGYSWFPSSICLGAQDYGNSISHYLDHIKDKDNPLYIRDERTKIKKINDNWSGKNSWLNIFLNIKNLYIIGLDLKSQETSFRWLLEERQRHISILHSLGSKDVYQTIYYEKAICKDNKDKKPEDKEKEKINLIGKRFFLEAMGGVGVREFDEFSELYDGWEME